MMGRGDIEAPTRAVTYCVIPRGLADALHEPLRRHFAQRADVEIVVEQRSRDRRNAAERRGERHQTEAERRRIRNIEGRRVADRRASTLSVAAPLALPRRARKFAGDLVFFERIEPTDLVREDRDTARLVMRIQGGDQAAFADLYMRYFDRVYGYLRVIFNTSHDAEDATQQVFMRLIETISSYERRPRQPFRAWLFVVARNVAVSELRRRGRLEAVDPEELTRQRGGEEHSDLSALDWVSDRELVMLIERLPLAQRQVLFLRFVLDLAYSDIAVILERSEDDVRSLQSRAVRFLRARLASLGRSAQEPRPSRVRGLLRRAPVLHGRRWALSD